MISGRKLSRDEIKEIWAIDRSEVIDTLTLKALLALPAAPGAAPANDPVAVVRAFSHSVTGPNPLEIPGQQTITLRMELSSGSVKMTGGLTPAPDRGFATSDSADQQWIARRLTGLQRSRAAPGGGSFHPRCRP